ncbi:NUGGC [Branchiostoma lanceolatum]|uniref:NUGGC protein n=1 Tax=Branchiostoma lanceolatum TaxID=7740 RepID=A0A8K0F0I7_BRALA|nr:NUGGC [Branchiostoma lanceolatum]
MTRRQNSDGRPQFHLRRISHRTLSTAANNICFSNRITFVGRGDNVHYLVSSAGWQQRIFLSRRHCRLVRSEADDSHRLIDSSMTGLYVNDVKIAGSCVLEEGDVVTFGHPKGDTIQPGTRVRQPDSEHQFVFEACSCIAENPQQDVLQAGVHKRHKQLVGAAPTTPEMLGSFRVPKTIPKKKAPSPAVLTQTRCTTRQSASSLSSNQTTPPSSRGRPRTHSQGRDAQNTRSRSSTCPSMTRKDVGVQSSESSLESDTDTEAGFIEERRQIRVKEKPSERDRGKHVKGSHSPNPKQRALVKSPARSTGSLSRKNPGQNDVGKEVSGEDATEEHVDEYPLDLTLKYGQTGFDNKVDQQELNQNGGELEVQTPDVKSIQTENTANNIKAAEQPDTCNQEPSIVQVTVDVQKGEIQQTVQCDDGENVREESSKQPSQHEKEMDSFAEHGQENSAKEEDEESTTGTKAGIDGCSLVAPAISSKDAVADMSGHSMQSIEDSLPYKSVSSKQNKVETPDVQGLIEDTESPNKTVEESMDMSEEKLDESTMFQTLSDNGCEEGFQNTTVSGCFDPHVKAIGITSNASVEDDSSLKKKEIAGFLKEEQEMKKNVELTNFPDVDTTVKSPDPVEDSSIKAHHGMVEDHHFLEKKEIADVLTDEQEINDPFTNKLTDVDAAVKYPKSVENSSIQAQDDMLVEDHNSLEKKQMADVLTDEQEIQDPFADKLTDVNAVMSSKPVEDSSVQSQDSISAANSHSLEKKEIADVLTDEQERKDPFADKLTDVDAKVKSPKPVEDSSVQAQGSISAGDAHSLETKKIADVLTDEQEDPFADKLTDKDATVMSPKPVEDSSKQAQYVLVEDRHSLQKKEIADVLTDKQEIDDPFADKLTDEDVTAMSPKSEEDNIQSEDEGLIFDTTVSLTEETHPVLREDKLSVADERQTCGNKVEETARSVNTDSLYQTLASEKYNQALEDTNEDLSPSNPSNQTEEKDNGVKIDDCKTSSQSEDKAEVERDVTDPILEKPTLLKEEELKSPVKVLDLLQSAKKSDPLYTKSAIDDTAGLMLEKDAPVTDGMEKEENDEEIILSHASQGSSITPFSGESKSGLHVKDGSDYSISSESASVDDEDPSISPSSPVIDHLHDTNRSTQNTASDDSTAWVLEELEHLEVSPEIPPLSQDGNTKDASQDLPQQPSICDVPSILENETEKEMKPSSQGSNGECDSGESSDSHMGMLRLSPSGKSGINASQTESDVENKDVETPLSQNSTGSDFGMSGIVPFVASPTGSQDDSSEALYSKVVAEIQANEDTKATPTHFGIQDQKDARDDNVTTDLKKSVTFEVKDSGLDTDSKENDDLSRDDLEDNFIDRDSRFIVSGSIDYRADDDNYSSDSESSSSEEEDPSNVGGAGLGLHLSDSEGEAEEKRHSSKSISQHKEHFSFGHHIKDQSKDVTELPEESNEGKKENEFSDSTDIEDVLSDNFQETSTQLAKSEEGRKEVLQLEEKPADETSLSKDLPSRDESTGKLHNISTEEEYVAKARSEEGRKEVLQLEEMPADDTSLSKDMPSQDAGTGKLPYTSEDEEDVAKDMETEQQMVTSGETTMERSSSRDQLNQDGENDSEHDISKPFICQTEELRPKRQLNTKSEDESANETLLCADNVKMHSHVKEENPVIDGQPCVGGVVVMQSTKRPHDENDTVLPHKKRLHLDAQLEKTDNTEAKECTLMDVLSEECENIPEDLPCAIEDNFDVQCEETKNKDTAHFEQKSLPLILVKSRAECVRDVVLDFFTHRFFVYNMSSKLDMMAEDARKQKVAEEVKTFFASGVWKEQPTTRTKDGSVEPMSEIASDNNSSAKEEEVRTCENILEVDKRKVIEDAVYDFFKMKNFAATKKLDSGTEDTVPAIEETSLEKPCSTSPVDNSTSSDSQEPGQTSQDNKVPEVCNDVVVQEDSETDANSESSLPSLDGYSDSESDRDSNYSENDRFLSSNSMEYGAESMQYGAESLEYGGEFDSDENMDESDQDDEEDDSSEDEEDDDATSEEDEDDDKDSYSSAPESPTSSTAKKTNASSKDSRDTEQELSVELTKATTSDKLGDANEDVTKETEKQSNEMALQGLSCDFDDDDEFSAPHINIDDIDFDDDNFDDPSMQTSSNLHSPTTNFSLGKDVSAQEKRNMAAVKASELPELEKSKKMTNVAPTGDNLGLGTSRDSAGNTATKPPASKPTNVSSGKETTDKTLGVGEDKENPVAQTTEETPGVLPTNAGRTRRRLVDTPGKVTTDNAPRYMEQCQTILASLQGALDREPSLKDISRVQAWKKEAAKLGEKMSLPETIIAVVGDTGAGKSSLMNALLDQSSVLPTSGMRACTAVVVEVSNNDKNKNYEAQVEFLSRKEWDDELRLLLTDLVGEDGKAKRKPDPQSEAGIAWSKIKAVYGRVESYDILSKLPHVRHLLGSTKHISKSRAREFRSEIDRYVDSMDAPPARGPGSRDRSGGQLWPIVKRVKVQIPNCDVCSSGAILVDLPGVRDSNAARDNIAKQYFKNCNAIWIVASIHRAVDDKTAKELLGEGFRRQLLMDGQYGSIAFICTKTDDLRCSEIIRALNLEEEVEQLENEINALEMEKMSLTEEMESLREEEEVTDEELSVIQQKVNDLKEKVFELEQASEPIDETSDEEVIVDDDDRVKLNSLRTSMEDRQQIEQETKTSLKEIRSQIADKEKEMAGIERQVSRKQRQMSVMCAKARNQYSQTQIRADFKAGIREMKRKAGMMGEDADSDDDDEEAGDQDEEDIARGLKVFTVSSTEYLKLTNKLTRDGPAQVFSNVNDTQIPALREFVHEITNVRRESGTEKLIRSLGSFVSDIASYLLDEGTKNHGTRMSAKSIFEHHLGQLKTSLHPVLGTLQTDVDRSISICIHPKLKEGVQAAATMCQAVAKKWGAPTCKENRQAGGLHYSTYKATVRRSGVYKSPTYGPIDMNEDLSSPLYNTITISWQKVFDNGTLFFTLDNCKHSILSTLKEFLLKLRTELQALGMDADRVNRVGQQQLNSTKMRLDNALAELKEFITAQQREISRVMTPAVQNRMEPAYETCTNERGPGSFNRMRNHMDVHVVYEKDIMFDQASQVLLKQLADLEVDIVARMQVLCDQLCADLAVLYEPFWEAPVHCTILKKHLMDDMLAIHGKVKSLFKEAELKDLPPLPEPAPQPAALNQSTTGTNYSLMNTPGTSYTSNRATPSGSNPVTRVTPTQPLTHRMKQELVDMHSYGGATPPTQRYQFGGAMPPTHGYQFGVRSQPAGTTSGPSFSGVRNPVTGRFQSPQASASTYTSQPRVKREETPQVSYPGASTPLLNPTAVNQFRKRTLQGMTGPGNSQATIPPVLKKVKTEEGCFVTMMGQGGQVLRFPVVQTMTQVQHNSSCQHSQPTDAAASPFLHRAAAPASSQSLPTTTKGSYGGNTGKLPSTQGFASAKSGKTSASTYSTGKSVTSQGLSSAKAKVTSCKSQPQSSSSGRTGLVGKKTPKKGGKGKGSRVIQATVPAARQQVSSAVRVKQEPRSPLRENQRRKKRKFQPDEIIDLTLDD